MGRHDDGTWEDPLQGYPDLQAEEALENHPRFDLSTLEMEAVIRDFMHRRWAGEDPEHRKLRLIGEDAELRQRWAWMEGR